MVGRVLGGRVAVGLVVVSVGLVLAVPASAMPAAGLNFRAMGVTNQPGAFNVVPPDPTGAVGPTDYVEAVNGGIEVFNKSGTVLAAAKSLNTLWAGYVGTNAGNGCSARNDGDPIVRYDRLADRWLISQFSLPNTGTDAGPSFQCVAVSKTSDPTGAYWLYDFKYPYAINDYAKIGVWPDAYYATFNMFSTTAYMGADICALDRTAMLNGQPAKPQQCFLLANPSQPACPNTQNFVPFSILAANADGSLPPPTGSPEYLMQFDYSQCAPPYNQLDLWKLHIDWATPANSTLSAPTALSVADFTPACYTAAPNPNCIPQPGSTTTLDSLGDRLMDRLVYRNYGTHQSLFLNHTVTAGAGAGIRWYEIRSPDTTPSVYQQGTYAPADSNWRFMGSIAADQAGDVALGYSMSASSGGVAHAAIAWTGRLAGDALGTMGQGESILNVGTANAPDEYTLQVPDPHRARWGDYSSMTVDPNDDCTFWYVNEVQKTTSATGWDTYIQTFKFPNCGQNDFTIAPTGGVAASQGASGSTTISTGLSKGTAESVQLTAFDLPTGATASFNPGTVTAGSSSTLKLTAGANTPVGTYTVEVSGTAPSAVHGTPVTFTVDSSRTLTVTKAGLGSGTVASTPAGINCGATCAVSFPDGTHVTLTPTPDVSSTFAGWSGACTGTSGCTVTMTQAQAVTATFKLRKLTLKVSKTGHGTITSSPLGISCGLTCSHAFPYGTSVTLTAHAASGYVFSSWSGDCSGTARTCKLLMTTAHSATAHFVATKVLTVLKAGTGSGLVTSSPVGISCGSICKHAFIVGTVVTLTPSANSGSTFKGWSGACTGTGNCVVTMSAAESVTATFAPAAAPQAVSTMSSRLGSELEQFARFFAAF